MATVNRLATLPAPPPVHTSPLHINQLGDSILVLIFDQLPLCDLVQLGAVCQQWRQAQKLACRSRKSLFLLGPFSKYTVVLLQARYGIAYDQFNCYRMEWADLTLEMCQSFSDLFPNITRLEFSGHSDENTFYFLSRLFGRDTWFPKLTELKVIIGPLSYAHSDEDDNDFMMRIQNHFFSWVDLLEDINFAEFAKQLKHLTLYNANILRDFRNIPLNIEENFTNLTALEELYFGVQCENIADVLNVVRGMKHLRKFVLFDDDAHVSQERSVHEDLIAIEPELMQQWTELCLVYTDEQVANNVLCVETISARCTSLTHLHLYCSTIAPNELFGPLAQLEHLQHLRLSGFSQQYFSKPQDLPQLTSLRTLQLNCTRVLNYSQLQCFVEHCLPALLLIEQPVLSGLYFMDDFLFPEEDPYIDDSQNRLVVMSPNKRIKAELDRQNYSRSYNSTRYRKTSLANVQLESASLLVLEQLFPLLSRFDRDRLKYLRLDSPADNFAILDQGLFALPPISDQERTRLHSLQTLHLDCSASGQLPCSDKFPLTSQYWPNIKLLKLDGLRSKPNYFELSQGERQFLLALPPQFRQLKKVLLIKDCSDSRTPLARTEENRWSLDDDHSSDIHKVNFYSVQYLLQPEHRDDELETSESKSTGASRLLLMVGQKLTF